jgi:hypothetical protein
MKKAFLWIWTCLLLQSVVAQSRVQLNIDHRLGAEIFQLDQIASNNLQQEFQVTRLEYYLSQVTLVYDGGKEIVLEDYYLIRPEEATFIDLGFIDLSQLEAIQFGIGIDSATNHEDPSLYDPSHPLGPKDPSMHWGWAAGYRFVAYEGATGPNFGRLFQYHALGDQNYFQVYIPLSLASENDEIIIELIADYSKAFRNVEVERGDVVHGDFGAAVTLLENFRDHVFKWRTEVITAVSEDHQKLHFQFYPNPVRYGKLNVEIPIDQPVPDELLILSMDGRQVQRMVPKVGSNQIDMNTAGVYMLLLKSYGRLLSSHKIVVE